MTDIDLADLRPRLHEAATAELAGDPVQRVKQRAIAAALVSEAFRRAGLRVTVVGGAAIEFHAPGAYTTDDLDLVVEGGGDPAARGELDRVFGALGFTPRGRHWVLGTMFVEVPGRTMEDPAADYSVGDHTLRLARPEVLLADRVVGFRHWRYTAYGLQALAMLAAFGEVVDQAWLEARLRREDALTAYRALKDLHASGEVVNEGVLQELLERLERGTL
jgi:hypothetical protein